MTREEEIRNAVDKIIPIPHLIDGRTYEQALMEIGFEAGVKWTDFHPKSPWISVDDDLPCNHNGLLVKHSPYNGKLTKPVLTLVDDGSFQVCDMLNEEGEWEWSYIGNVIYWMPIPELPKEQEIKL